MPTTVAHKKQIDSNKIRADFPILSRQVNGKSLIYLDNGATTQKPKSVVDTIKKYYEYENANIHRGVHRLSQDITEHYEFARTTLQKHINAKHSHEIIFTKGTTDSINLVASSFGRKFIHAGDEIIISEMEHHSNILPWQMLCEEKGASLKVIPVNGAGELMLDEFKKLLSNKTKLVAVTHISNTLGTINPVKEMIALAHIKNIPVLIDGAQAIPHTSIDVQELDCDFYCFSGHKVYAPTGTGILYGKEMLLNEMPPYQGGGGIIKTVTFTKSTYAELPLKFEAGTPNIAGGIGFAAAIDYINEIGLEQIAAHEQELLHYATEKLMQIKGLKIIGTATEKTSVISFVIERLHALDVGMLLDALGIAVRTGHHCTQPLMKKFGIKGTIRASFSFYNTKEEIDQLVAGINKAVDRLNK